MGNEEGRSSWTDVDCMVQKAEKICAESESNKAKAEAKYGLKGLLLHFAHTLNKKRRGISSKVTTRRQGYSAGDSGAARRKIN